ncbi:MAG: SpoIIE family protein phosphatase [Chloroflexi bacterium]|nr:SpoIIE family protein phosphatase [Chloroflexota bacterium]
MRTHRAVVQPSRRVTQHVEIAWDSLSKSGEELCGDWVKVQSTPESLIVVLSDGLGSGVKANILATLTAEIASSMLERDESVDEVIETLAVTLPECHVRHLAYATIAMLQIVHGRTAYLVEYDTPPLILVRDGEVVDLPISERTVAGRTIKEGRFRLQIGDMLVMVSDGYVHAGVGGLYRMGWGRDNIATAVRRWAAVHTDAHELVRSLRRTCLKLYDGTPGDDATAIAMVVREVRRATVLTGPPSDHTLDERAVQGLMAAPGTKVICGGTTAQMVARILGKDLQVEWKPSAQRASAQAAGKLPPVARLDGVNLVTEGILTLSAAVDRLQAAETVHELPPQQDAGTRLARVLLEADEIHFIVGDAINPLQLADVVRGKPMRQIYLEQLLDELQRRAKQVTVEHL